MSVSVVKLNGHYHLASATSGTKVFYPNSTAEYWVVKNEGLSTQKSGLASSASGTLTCYVGGGGSYLTPENAVGQTLYKSTGSSLGVIPEAETWYSCSCSTEAGVKSGTRYYCSDGTYYYKGTITFYVKTTPSGKTFDHWEGTKTSSDATVSFTNQDCVATAVFKDYLSYKIKYYKNDGGTTSTTKTIAAGTTGTILSAADLSWSREGYVFKGWATSESGSVAYNAGDTIDNSGGAGGSLTLYAVWKTTHTVTFYQYDGGPWLQDVTVEDHGSASAPSYETRTGYTWAGWNQSFSDVTSDLTVYGTWNVNHYTVHYQQSDGETWEDYTTRSVAYNETSPTDVGTPSKHPDGKVFNRWPSYTITGERTIQATYRWIATTVKYNANGGSGTMADDTVVWGYVTPLTANAFTRESYTFWHWNTASDNTGTSYENEEDVVFTPSADSEITLYAIWHETTPTVTFDANGGVLNTSDTTRTVAWNTSMDNLPTASKTGCEFNGWWTAASGGTQVGIGTLITESQTIYAHYTGNKYTLKFDTDGAGTRANEEQICGTVYEITAPTKTNYTFVGWQVTSGLDANTAYWGKTASTCTTSIASSSTLLVGDAAGASVYVTNLNPSDASGSAVVTMTARWRRIRHTVTINAPCEIPSGVSNVASRSVQLKANETGTFSEFNGTNGKTTIDYSNDSATATSTSTTMTVYAGVAYRAIVTTVFNHNSNNKPEGTLLVPSALWSGDTGTNISLLASGSDYTLSYYKDHTFTTTETATFLTLDNTAKKVTSSNNASTLFSGTTVACEYTLPTDTSAPFIFGVNAGTNSKLTFASWASDPAAAITGSTTTAATTFSMQSGTGGAFSDVALTTTYTKAKYKVTVETETVAYAAITGAGLPVPEHTIYKATTHQDGSITYSEITDGKVDYGDSIMLQLDIDGNFGAEYIPVGWYDGNGTLVSTTNTYSSLVKRSGVIGPITGSITYYVKYNALVTLNTDVGATGLSAIVTLDGTNYESGSCSERKILGDTISIGVVPNGTAVFVNWHKTGQEYRDEPLDYAQIQSNITLTDTLAVSAYILAQAMVYYVAVYNYNTTGTGEYRSGLGSIIFNGNNYEEMSDSGAAYKTALNMTSATWNKNPKGKATIEGTEGTRFFKVFGTQSVTLSVSSLTQANPFLRIKKQLVKQVTTSGETTSHGEYTNEETLSTDRIKTTTVNAHAVFTIEYGNPSKYVLKVSLPSNSDDDMKKGSVSITQGSNVSQPGWYQSAKYEQGAEYTILASPKNGYEFKGWYDTTAWGGEEEVTPVSTDALYTGVMGNADYTLYARFEPASYALYKWEGGSGNKELIWKSKVYELSKPANMTSVRVDATGYPLAGFKVESFSSPDSTATSTVNFIGTNSKIANQNMRRLPARRPERYFQVQVTSDSEVDAILIGTSGAGLAT